MFLVSLGSQSIESLSNNDGDGYENVSFFLQSVFTLFLNSLGLFHLPQFVKCWRFFLELNFRGLYKSSGQKRGVAVHVPCCNRATTAKKCTKQRVKLVFAFLVAIAVFVA